MDERPSHHVYGTHEVINQPPPLENLNLFLTDRALRDAVVREGGAFAQDRLVALGAVVGAAETMRLAEQANRFPPELRAFDRFGNRIDEVDFHPAYHTLMALAVEHRVPSYAWVEKRPGAHVARAALAFLWGQAEAGVSCPMAMTFAGTPVLRHLPDLAREWEPRFTSGRYDSRFIPAKDKTGATFGMAMTEKQGGSDVRANSTRARAVGARGPGCEYLLTGHKWFCSAPMSDAFLTLAYAEGGLSCFFVPRFLPDGTKNRIFIQRLKSKLGNRSNASSEIEYDETWGRLVGEEGRGIATIIEMVQGTRLECALGSAALMRQALVQALHHASHRSAFQRRLVDHALMRNVLADLTLESEAATALAFRVARAFGEGQDDEHARRFARIATAIAKYWICKRAPALVGEALECHGGNGYVEESVMPRLYREAPVNGIWEGSGNVICLDVLRTLEREPESVELLLAELSASRGLDARYDRFLDRLGVEIENRDERETRARRLIEALALALEAAILLRNDPANVANAFCASRLDGDRGLAFGTLPTGFDAIALIERAMPSEP
ncbi:MAG TPA: isovaleryl-CoA dehydrogenase [Alphaproteobacteria bacterium]|nr:isovaleryl-CoA dehydrogenase [Alphaproteobacteria bacterium]